MRAKIHPEDMRHNIPVWKAARSTTAAPTYFPPTEIGAGLGIRRDRSISPTDFNSPPYYSRNRILVEDGGTTSNNPTFLGIRYALKCLGVSGNLLHYDLQVVSLGTGSTSGKESPPPLKSGNGSFSAFVREFRSDPLFISRNAYNIHNLVMNKYFDGQEGPGTGYFRVQFKLKKEQIRIDNIDTSNLNNLIEQARSYMFDSDGKYSAHFQGILDMLAEDVQRPDLRIKTEDLNFRVKARFFGKMGDYFYYTTLDNSYRGPTLMKDIYHTLLEIEDAKGPLINRPKKSKKKLIIYLKDHLYRRLAESFLTNIEKGIKDSVHLIKDSCPKYEQALENDLRVLNFGPALARVPTTVSLWEALLPKSKFVKHLVKQCRKVLLESLVFRDVCQIGVKHFDKIVKDIQEADIPSPQDVNMEKRCYINGQLITKECM
jgi:hypothetical protein